MKKQLMGICAFLTVYFFYKEEAACMQVFTVSSIVARKLPKGVKERGCLLKRGISRQRTTGPLHCVHIG